MILARKILLMMVILNIGIVANAEDSSAKRIVGGKEAVEGDAPFIVSLRKKSQHFCGGSLIAKQWVLTAAHCIAGMGNPDDITSGSLVSGSSSKGKKHKVEIVIVHPDFNKKIDMGSDFALIKIKQESDSEVTEFAEINSLSPSELKITNFSIAGWGAIKEGAFSTPKTLQVVDVPYVTQAACEEQLQNYESSKAPYLDNSMFCAGMDAKDACQGDSGGPIYYKDVDSKKFVVAGVVSWGIGCARKNLSGIYSNTAFASQWIQETMKAN